MDEQKLTDEQVLDLRKRVLSRISVFQDIYSWQPGESRNAYVMKIWDAVNEEFSRTAPSPQVQEPTKAFGMDEADHATQVAELKALLKLYREDTKGRHGYHGRLGETAAGDNTCDLCKRTDAALAPAQPEGGKDGSR